MPKINKVVTTLWYNKEDMRALRNVFPKADFCYVDFYDKDRRAQYLKYAEVAIMMGYL